jgi:hypothetical protein
VDGTDFYMFRSPDPGPIGDSTVTLIANFIPFEEPAGGPNFYSFDPNAKYDINIDNNGDAKADIVYEWTFTNHYRSSNTFLYNTGVVTSLTDSDLNFYQTYDLNEIKVATGANRLLVNNAVAVPSRAGDASMPNYSSLWNQGINQFGNGNPKNQTFAGQADDPFFLDLRVFDLLYGGNLSEVGDDTLAGFNVNTMALQIRMNRIAKGGDATAHPIIGAWSTAERKATLVQNADGSQNFSGGYVQVSRLGAPLVNEVVIPVGDKDKWNGSEPQNDSQFASYVTNPELPNLIQAIYGIPAPATPRNDLVQVFLTGIPGLNQPPGVVGSEELRLNMSTPTCEQGTCPGYSRLGVIAGDNAGYPNGRRLGDDIIDISLQVVEGVLVGQPTGLGDGVNTNDVPFQSSFPYEAMPHSGSDATPHP